ncbi:MAG: M67 family metallopeptidase [Planctomycetales bacterium]|nr:M67 family metallopeptidase [Planctomycetales bacterium]
MPTSPLPPVEIPRAAHEEMRREAERGYPREGCGMFTGAGGDPRSLAFHPCANIQDEAHAADPARHPRDARTAYLLDPKAMLALLRASEREGRAIAGFFHSHPEHGAYFSETDRRDATPLGEPSYPEAFQVVVSVRGGRAGDVAAFRWDPAARDFREVPLRVLP